MKTPSVAAAIIIIHYCRSRNIFYALAERGHNVTSISPDTEKSLSPGVHFMQIDGLYGNSYKSLIESLQEEDAVNPILQLSMLFESIEVPCKGKIRATV